LKAVHGSRSFLITNIFRDFKHTPRTHRTQSPNLIDRVARCYDDTMGLSFSSFEATHCLIDRTTGQRVSEPVRRVSANPLCRPPCTRISRAKSGLQPEGIRSSAFSEPKMYPFTLNTSRTRPCGRLLPLQTPLSKSLRIALLYNTWLGRLLLKLPVRGDSVRRQSALMMAYPCAHLHICRHVHAHTDAHARTQYALAASPMPLRRHRESPSGQPAANNFLLDIEPSSMPGGCTDHV
jgi:hypothetical protein